MPKKVKTRKISQLGALRGLKYETYGRASMQMQRERSRKGDVPLLEYEDVSCAGKLWTTLPQERSWKTFRTGLIFET